MRAQRLLDAEIEVALLAAAAVESQQGLEVGVGQRTAEGAAAHGGEDGAGARFLILSGGRAAHKDPGAAGRVAGTRDVIGSGDRDSGGLRRIVAFGDFKALQLHAIQAQIQFGHRRRRSAAGRRAPGLRRRWRWRRASPAEQRDFGLRGFPQEGHADGPQARRHRLANFQLAIAPPPWPSLHADDVLGIHREVVAQREAAARIEGKIVAHALVAVPPAAARTVAARREDLPPTA